MILYGYEIVQGIFKYIALLCALYDVLLLHDIDLHTMVFAFCSCCKASTHVRL